MQTFQRNYFWTAHSGDGEAIVFRGNYFQHEYMFDSSGWMGGRSHLHSI